MNFMTIKKRNAGMENLTNLGKAKEGIMNGASVKQNIEDKSSTKRGRKITKRQLILPMEFNDILKTAKENRRIICSINTYIVEATKKRMIEDGLIVE